MGSSGSLADTSATPTASRLAQKLGAEFIATFALVFAGCGAMAVDGLTGGSITHLGVSLTFGLVVLDRRVGHVLDLARRCLART